MSEIDLIERIAATGGSELVAFGVAYVWLRLRLDRIESRIIVIENELGIDTSGRPPSMRQQRPPRKRKRRKLVLHRGVPRLITQDVTPIHPEPST